MKKIFSYETNNSLKLKEEEIIFRSKIRLENSKYKDWIILEKRIKTIIINWEKFSINLTQYLDKKN